MVGACMVAKHIHAACVAFVQTYPIYSKVVQSHMWMFVPHISRGHLTRIHYSEIKGNPTIAKICQHTFLIIKLLFSILLKKKMLASFFLQQKNDSGFSSVKVRSLTLFLVVTLHRGPMLVELVDLQRWCPASCLLYNHSLLSFKSC